MAASLSDAEILDILMPLLDNRPEFRKALGLHLAEGLQKELDFDQVTAKSRPPVYKRPTTQIAPSSAKNPNPPSAVIDDPALAMFVHIRRVVLKAQQRHLKEHDVDRLLEEEWAKQTDIQKAHWLDIALSKQKQAAGESATNPATAPGNILDQ